MNSRLSRRLMIALGLVLTLAALAAPSANAKMQRIYSDRGVALIPSNSEPNPNYAYADRGLVPTYPDGMPVTIYSDHGIATIPPAQSQTSFACSSQGCVSVTPPQNGPTTPVSKVSDESPGFDWSKTGYIVSLSMVGLLLLGGGALLAGKHNRRRRLAAA